MPTMYRRRKPIQPVVINTKSERAVSVIGWTVFAAILGIPLGLWGWMTFF